MELTNLFSFEEEDAKVEASQAAATILAAFAPILAEVAMLPLDQKVEAINALRLVIHNESPFKSEPVDLVTWIKNDLVHSNDYNPNSVAKPEMELLRISIENDGYCCEESTPILCADLIWRKAGELKEGDKLIAFDEENPEGKKKRSFRPSAVIANRIAEEVLWEVETTKGTVQVTGDHPWLGQRMKGDASKRNLRWIKTEDMLPGDILIHLMQPWETDRSWEAGWLAGMLDGEGTLSQNQRKGHNPHVRLACYQRPSLTADRMIHEMTKRSLTKIFVVKRDQDHAWSDMTMARIDRMVDIMRVLGTVRPERLLENTNFWEGCSIALKDNRATVISVRKIGIGHIAKLSTSTKTYIGAGFAMHNTQPIVSMPDGVSFEVIDGFHRHRVGKECADIQERVKGYLPLVQIRKSQQDKSERMASTIRHNRARGKHQVEAMSDIVIELKRRNWTDEKIAKNLGMDADEVLRLCQISGLAEAFKDQEFTEAWEVKPAETEAGGEVITDIIADFEPKDKGRVFHTWEKWECYRAGFYAEVLPEGGEEAYQEFLADLSRFRAALQVVTTEWVYSCEHYLTNDRMNRIAWLGQAAVAQALGIPSGCRGGYHLLTQEQRNAADGLALEYLNLWLVAHQREPVDFEKAGGRTEAELY